MEEIIKWFKASHRIRHLLLGIGVGLGADDWYCAEYVGIGVAGSLEFKDYQWGGKPDWIDFTLTFVGVNIGYTIRYFTYE